MAERVGRASGSNGLPGGAPFLDALDAAVLLFDETLTLCDYSRRAAAWLDLAKADLGASLTALLDRLADPALPDDAADVLSGAPERRAAIQPRGGGYLSRRATPWDGKLLVVYSDVSDAEWGTRLSVAARAYAETVIQTVAEPILVMDHALRMVALSGPLAQRYIEPSAARAGAPLADFGPAWNNRGLSAALLRALRRGGQASPVRLEGAFGDAGRRVICVHARATPGLALTSRRLVLAIEDVTEREAARERFNEMAARYDLVLEAAPEAIVTVDENGHVTSFSLEAERLLGYEAADIVGWSVERILPGERNGVASGFSLFTEHAGQQNWRRKVVCLTRDGAEIELDFAPYVGRSDSHQAFIGVFRDLSIAMIRREELRRLSQMESIARLTSGVAHDFNNMLAVIGGSLELIEEDTPAEKVRELIGDALEAVEQGGSLTAQLLAFGGRSRAEATLVDLNAEAVALATLARRTLPGDVEIATKLGDGPQVVRVNAGLLRSALLNLVHNARDAMPQGGALAIETARRTLSPRAAAKIAEAVPGEFASITFRDNGLGMAPEVLARAGEPYFTTKPESLGSGLGLSMVVGFVRQAGGFTQIRSAPGAGASVTLNLPLTTDARAAPEPDPSASEAGVAGDETPAHLPSILVVDDDPRMLETFRRRLRALGYDVTSIEDSKAALNALRAGTRPEVLLTDVMMPGGLDGFALARAAREIAPDLAIVFTSGFPIPGAMLPRDSEFLPKPHDRRVLEAALLRARAQTRGR